MSEKREVARDNNVTTLQQVRSGNGSNYGAFNKAWVSGRIEEELEYSHEVLWEKFYQTRVRVVRLSGTEDYVPIVVSDLLLTNMLTQKLKGKYVEVGGQFRSHNKLGEDGRYHLELFLFVMAINVYESQEELQDVTDANLLYLEGYICRPPTYRTTPLSGRLIADLMVAVNRNYGKTDYIPCIAWNKTAMCAKEFEVGDRIKLYGRIQSRQYLKRFSPESEEGEIRTVYEVSILRLAKLENSRMKGEISDK